MKDTFSLIRNLEALENQKKAGSELEQRKKLNGQIDRVHTELAKRGYANDQQQSGFLAPWAIYVEYGPAALRDLISAASTDEQFEALKRQMGIEDIPLDLKKAKTVLRLIDTRPTTSAARYIELHKRGELTTEEKSEKDALATRLRELGIDPDTCPNPLQWAIVLSNKSSIRAQLNSVTSHQPKLNTPITDDVDSNPDRPASHKGTRHPRRERRPKPTKRSLAAIGFFHAKLRRLGLTNMSPDEVRHILNTLTRAQRKRSDRRRKNRNARTLSESHIPAAEPATDIVVTMHDKILMDRVPHWKEVVTDPAYKEIMDNPTLRALATTETF
ncbi:hypothetical protein IKQ74_00395 [Candidatus Saccharibacteria bacterium]|nr:hypothetical protein [Candidatus Saccharibacteria bacterium]